MNIILLLGSALGLTSVIMAAFVDHSLALQLTGKSLNGLLTAVRYHQQYAILIVAIGLSMPLQGNKKIRCWLARTVYVFVAGVFLFSGSIYLSAMTGVTAITCITPFGGILLMMGWAILLRAALIAI